MKAYLKLDHVDKVFTRGKVSSEVLKDINLSLGKGEYVSIIGHSGCGKSTMLNIIAGLTRATMGGVILEDREVNSPGPDRAVVFQNHSLLPWLTVIRTSVLAWTRCSPRPSPAPSATNGQCTISISCR
jgi:nitrate/nitrite transport system ATP-binding protein